MYNSGYLDKIMTLFVQLPMVIFFTFIFVLLMKKIQFQNSLLTFFGEISLEMILINKVFVLIFSLDIFPITTHIYFLLEFACTIIAAFLIYKLKIWIIGEKRPYRKFLF
jgi:hypothetical protein